MDGKYDYKFEGVGFRILANPVNGTTALSRYWNPDVTDHFYTTNYCEREGSNPYEVLPQGYKKEGTLGFCFCDPAEGTVPLHRYFIKSHKDHFYTTNFQELGSGTGKSWYSYQGIQCYVYPA